MAALNAQQNIFSLLHRNALRWLWQPSVPS